MPCRRESDVRLYRFGPFEADTRSGELRKHRIRLKLREQPFRILLMLLEAGGETVQRDDIRLKLWPENTTVDFDHGINTAVKRLRDALGDTAAQPRYVETVGRRGYRFLAEIESVREPEARNTTPRWLRWRWAIVVAGLLLVAAGWRFRRPAAPADEILRPLTAYPGVAGHPSLSPDGSRVAFSWGGDRQENPDIYIRQIDSGALVRLTAEPAADGYPAWSPDDRSIAFIRTGPRGASVMLVPSLGGPERTITLLGPSPGPREFGAPVPLCWTPDGKWLAIATRGAASEPVAIWLFSVVSGERRRLTSPPTAAVEDSNPSVSPDGKFLAFSRGRVSQYAHRVYVVNLGRNWTPTGAPRPLPCASYAVISGIAWANTDEIVYAAGAGATGHLWRVRVSGRDPARRLNMIDDALCPTISTRSGRLVYAWRTFDSSIWRLDARTRQQRPLIVARGVHFLPQYSPDGGRIAFASTRSGEQEIWTCNSEGSGCRQLTSLGGPQTGVVSWSPDGRWLVFDARPGRLAQIYVISAEGGPARRLSSGKEDDFSPSWSHDGRWIYFSSNRTGRWEIWRMPAAGEPSVRLTFDGGLLPQEQPGGKFIYYVKREEPGLFRLPADGGRESRILPALPNRNDWALSAQGVYFVQPAEGFPNGTRAARRPCSPVLRFKHFLTGQVRTVAPLQPGTRAGFAVSPDGRYVLGSRFQTKADLMLVEHFR